mmetsp:Transcript_41930/g.94721  ORF Transcript_41930/g.94721 Transcript_41930/m.94721 type:complete len:244 (-) Transcript_41930:62-793(-)
MCSSLPLSGSAPAALPPPPEAARVSHKYNGLLHAVSNLRSNRHHQGDRGFGQVRYDASTRGVRRMLLGCFAGSSGIKQSPQAHATLECTYRSTDTCQCTRTRAQPGGVHMPSSASITGLTSAEALNATTGCHRCADTAPGVPGGMGKRLHVPCAPLYMPACKILSASPRELRSTLRGRMFVRDANHAGTLSHTVAVSSPLLLCLCAVGLRELSFRRTGRTACLFGNIRMYEEERSRMALTVKE